MPFIPSTDINSGIQYGAGKIAKAQGAGNIDTGWVDRTDFDSATLLGQLGAAAGGPATQSLKLQLWDADDDTGTNAAQVKPDGVTADSSVTGAAADNAITQHGVRFSNCRQWVKARAVLAFTGGAGPTNDVSVQLILGGARNMPTTPPNP
jgi:hypothetical protein